MAGVWRRERQREGERWQSVTERRERERARQEGAHPKRLLATRVTAAVTAAAAAASEGVSV